MRTARRRSAILLLVLVMALATGCTRFTGSVTVNADDSVSMNYDFSVPDDPANAKGIEAVKAKCADNRRFGQFFRPVKTEYAEAGRVGCRIRGDANQRRLGQAGIAIYHQDGKQHFSFGEGMLEQLDPEGPKSGPVRGIEQFELKVTFRGKVVSHSGSSTVDGTTVTWRDANDLRTGINAAAQEPGLFDRTVGEWVAIGVGAAGLLGFLGWAVVDSLRRPRVRHTPPWGGPTHR
ncbi:LppM family (lipo)protein [Mariniluteicoccus flavus]